MQVNYRIESGDSETDAQIRKHFSLLTLEDVSGEESDYISLQLNDGQGAAPFLQKGLRLHVWIGLNGVLVDKGIFEIDDPEVSGPPDRLIYKASAAEFKGAMKEKVDRSWLDTTVGAIVSSIAAKHGLTPAISEDLASIAVAEWYQTAESDLHTLTRLGKQYGAVAKPVNRRLVFVYRGDAKTATGKTLPVVTIDRSMCSHYRFMLPERKKYRAVETRWNDLLSGEEKTVMVGSGSPVDRLRHKYANEQDAQKAAQAKLRTHLHGKSEFTGTVTGVVDLVAESEIVSTGFRAELPSRWVASRVTYTLGANGLVCSFVAKRKVEK